MLLRARRCSQAPAVGAAQLQALHAALHTSDACTLAVSCRQRVQEGKQFWKSCIGGTVRPASQGRGTGGAQAVFLYFSQAGLAIFAVQMPCRKLALEGSRKYFLSCVGIKWR